MKVPPTIIHSGDPEKGIVGSGLSVVSTYLVCPRSACNSWLEKESYLLPTTVRSEHLPSRYSSSLAGIRSGNSGKSVTVGSLIRR